MCIIILTFTSYVTFASNVTFATTTGRRVAADLKQSISIGGQTCCYFLCVTATFLLDQAHPCVNLQASI